MGTVNITPNGDNTIVWNVVYNTDLTPNGNTGTNDWVKTDTTWWESVEDYEDADYIFAGDADDNDEQEIDFTTITNLTDCSQVVVYLYGKDLTGTPNVDVSIEVQSGGGYEGDVSVNFGTSYSWKTATFTGLGGVNQADIDALTVRLTAPAIGAIEGIYIKGIFCRITYTGTADSYPQITDSSDDSYIWCEDGDESDEDIYDMTTSADAWETTSIEVFCRGKCVQNALNIRVDLYNGSDWEGSQLITDFVVGSWVTDSSTFTGLEIARTDLANVKIKIIAPAAIAAGDEVFISEMYATLTYSDQPKLTNSDVLSGTISQSEMGYQKGSFTLKKGTTVEEDYLLEFTEDYTSDSSTGSQVIFEGLVQEYSLTDLKKITCGSKGDEVSRIRPLGMYSGLVPVCIDKMLDAYKDYLSTSYGTTTITGYFDAVYNFAQDNAESNTGTNISWIDRVTGISAVIDDYDDGGGDTYSVHNGCIKLPCNSTNDAIYHDMGTRESGSIEFWVAFGDATAINNKINILAGSDIVCGFRTTADGSLEYYNNTGYVDSAYNLIDGEWYWCKVSWYGDNTWGLEIEDNTGTSRVDQDGMGTYTDNVDPDTIFLNAGESGVNTIYFDAYDMDWNNAYTSKNNQIIITYTTPSGGTNYWWKPVSGGQTLQACLTEGATLEKYIWALAPDGDIRWHDGTDTTGITLDDSINIWDVRAKYQVKRINRVVLKGAGGIEAVKNDTTRQDSAGQVIIYKDYIAGITNQGELDTMAQKILDTRKNPPLIINLSMQWEAKGWLQVGEQVTITGSKIKYNKSSSYIPAGDYRITRIKYHIKDGAYHYIDLTLADGLSYREKPLSESVDQNTQNANYGYGGGTIKAGGSSGLSAVVDDITPQLGGDLDLNGKNIDFPTTPNISDVKDEDNMASNSATMLATQQSIKAYVDTQVATKDTKEEAHAYVEATALTLENDLNMGTHKITGVVDPVNNQEAATKKYVDDNAGGGAYIWISGNIYCSHVDHDYGGSAVFLDTLGDQCRTSCQIPSEADTSKDVVVYIAHSCAQADATVGCRWYIGANAIGSEAQSNNIDNGGAVNIDSTVADRLYQKTYTFANAGISDGDLLSLSLRLWEDARTVSVCDVMWRFEL